MNIDRSTKPAATGEIKFSLPEIEVFKLKNDLEINFVKKDNLPITQFNLIINAGSKFDPNDKFGLAHLTSMMLDEGAGEYSALELNEEIDSIGSVIGLSTDYDCSYISMLSLNEHLDRSISLFSKILKSPLLSEEDFTREKEKLSSKILQLNDDPAYVASIEFEKQILKGSDYAHPISGEVETVANITLDDIRKNYKEKFLPKNAKLVVVGNISKQELIDKLETHFTDWIGGTLLTVDTNVVKKEKQEIIIIDRKDSEQSELRVGSICDSRNIGNVYARAILNTILGGQFASRINSNLREKRGFTYGANSTFDYNRLTGTFEISTAVNSDNTGESIREILIEMEDIKKEIKEQEIDFAKSYSIKRYPAMFETYSQIARNITLLIIHNLDKNYFDNYIDNTNAVTLEDLYNEAKRNIDTAAATIVIAGDADKIKTQLENENITTEIKII